MMREKFPNIGGFQSTLLQETSLINTKPTALQIIHVRHNHWAAVHITEKEQVCVYDSGYFDCNDDTLIVIAQLIRSSN